MDAPGLPSLPESQSSGIPAASIPASENATTMSPEDRRAFYRSLVDRMTCWRITRNDSPYEFWTKPLPTEPMPYLHSAKDFVDFLTENCYAAQMDKRDEHESAELTAYYSAAKGIRINHDNLQDLADTLRQWLAQLDHDFFFGMLTRPVSVGGTWMPNEIGFDLTIMDAYDRLELQDTGEITRYRRIDEFLKQASINHVIFKLTIFQLMEQHSE
ncbi:hypothetical protein TruAng_004492 [Truncatella angustata]|nr:hypothetical protein TruAng_004492 [Truncatella angustata]